MQKTIWRRFSELVIVAFVLLYSSNASALTYNICDDAAEYPPYIYKNLKGYWTGISYDLFGEVMKLTNQPWKFEPLEWNDCLDAVKNGKNHALLVAAYNNKRIKLYDYSSPFTNYTPMLFWKKSRWKNQPKITNVIQLLDWTICGTKGYSYEWLLGVSPKKFKNDFGSDRETVQGLLDNSCEFAPAPYEVIKGFELLGKLSLADIGYHANPAFNNPQSQKKKFLYLIVSKKNPPGNLLEKFNDGLAQIKANGTYDRIYNQYFGAGK